MTIVEINNPFDNDFSVSFDGQPYVVPSMDKLLVTEEVGKHIAYHMSQYELVERMKSEGTLYSRIDIEHGAAKFISDPNAAWRGNTDAVIESVKKDTVASAPVNPEELETLSSTEVNQKPVAKRAPRSSK